MFIPGFFISILTFPGVIVHEVAHQLFCRLANVAVFDVCYFRFGNPAGYVIHEIPKKRYEEILIGIGPFILNSILGAIVALPAAIPVIKFSTGSTLDYFLIWLGVSIAMHSFPSSGDAKNIWAAVISKDTSIWIKIIGTPIVGLIFLGAIGSAVWLDLLYGIGVAMLIPNIIIQTLV